MNTEAFSPLEPSCRIKTDYWVVLDWFGRALNWGSHMALRLFELIGADDRRFSPYC